MLRFIILLGINLILFSSCKIKSDDKFSYNLIPVKTDEKWGYIDQEGKYVINPQFKDAALFSDGLALVQTDDSKYGYISDDGKFVINPSYKYATSFSEGMAIVTSENGFPTCIDKKGDVKFVIKDATMVGSSVNGLLPVKIKDKWGFINNEGKIIVNPQFDDINKPTEGLTPTGIKVNENSNDLKWGFIDNEGKIVITPQFANAESFKEGKSLVYDGKKYGYIDQKGLYVINPQFEEAKSFSEDLAAVKQGESWGFIDKSGKFVINPQFEEVSNFSNGLAAVKSGKESWGYIDKEGKFTINPQFSAASKFYGKFATVSSGDKIGLIDQQGKYLVNPQFSETFSYYTWTKTFVDWEQNSYASSDFYDATEVTNQLLKLTSSNTFCDADGETSLQELLNQKMNKEKLFEKSKYSVVNNTERKLDSEIRIENIEYNFQNPIYSESYFYGKQFNLNSKVNNIECSIKINEYGKARGKANIVAETIQKELIKKYGGSKDKIQNAESQLSMEERATQIQDSIAAEISKSMNENTNVESNSSESSNDFGSKSTFYVYTKDTHYKIVSDGKNSVVFKVYFTKKRS